MCKHNTMPATLVEAIRYFADAQVCHDFMVNLRWPDGVVKCHWCGSENVGFISTRRKWQCRNKECKKQFSTKVGTIFEDSPLGMDKWLPAVWLIANCKNGVSSHELARSLGVTQKSAWFMLHRIRLAMQAGSIEGDFLRGETEADETFIGGKARNMHKGKRKAKGTGGVGKAIVMGLLERGGKDKPSKVRAKVLPNRKKAAVQEHLRANVYRGSEVFTDALPSYNGIEDEYAHQVVDHAECYVNGKVHTNGLENFWSLLKRGISGTYVSVMPFHLFRYIDEQAFRFNQRQGTDAGRFLATLLGVVGKRVTYAKLTANDAT